MRNGRNTEKCVRIFLKKMSRVERTEVKIGGEIKTIFLNLTPELQEMLKLIGFLHLFKQDYMGCIGDNTTLKGYLIRSG